MANILQTPEEWQTAMGRNAEYGDDVLLQIASNVLRRRIEIAPLLGNRTITIGPEHTEHPAISLLYFSETRFHSPHYQSMTPVTRNSRIASIPEETDIFEHPILHSTELSGSGFYQDCDTYIASISSSSIATTVTTVTKQKTKKRDRELSYVESSNILNATHKRNKRQ
jgi:hypothetical protein